MSLKDLLPEGTYDILLHQTGRTAHSQAHQAPSDGILTVPCPECGRAVAYVPENPFRPFCSQRCKCLDLGAWADERRTLPGTALADEDGDSAPDSAQRCNPPAY